MLWGFMPITIIYLQKISLEEVVCMENISLWHKSEKKNTTGVSLNRTSGDQKGNTAKGKKTKMSVARSTKDTLKISQEALQKYREQLLVQQEMEAIRAQEEEKKDSKDDFGKIMTIFRRIANGDKVPAKDEQKLMEYSSEMYMAAKMAASMAKNKHPKKYKSVYDDEEENSLRIEEGEGTESAECNVGSSSEVSESDQ